MEFYKSTLIYLKFLKNIPFLQENLKNLFSLLQIHFY